MPGTVVAQFIVCAAVAGLGCSGLPLRRGVIPEITLIDVQPE